MANTAKCETLLFSFVDLYSLERESFVSSMYVSLHAYVYVNCRVYVTLFSSCRYLVQNISWLEEKLGSTDEDYIIFDCPGQLELYTHLTVMRDFIKMLQNLEFHVCGVFLLDVQFMVDAPKYLSGSLAALSVMINLTIPHVNVITKLDLLSKRAQKKLDSFMEPDVNNLLSDTTGNSWDRKYYSLTKAIGKVVTDYSLVRFLPLNMKDEGSIEDVRVYIDVIMNYDENAETKVRDFDVPDNEDNKEDDS